MQVTISDFGDQVTRVNLVGRLDIVGAQTIELPMATVSGSKCDVVVDMIGVDFIASIGIRHLVIAAQTLARSSRKLILLRPNEPITEVLMAAGLADVLPIVRSEDEARAALLSGS